MPSNLENSIGAFEERMALRRRMMSVTGARLPEETTKSLEEMMRESVIHCFECKNADHCAVWLEAVDPGVSPPVFCPNADINRRLQDMRSANA